MVLRSILKMKKSKLPILLLILFGSIGCGQSESNLEEKSTSIQPEVVTSAPSKPTENPRSNPTENPQSPATDNAQTSPESSGENPPQSTSETTETSESNLPKSEESQETNAAPTETPQKPDGDPIPTEYNFKADEEPIVPVGNFEFQLKQASLKKELVDSSTQKNYSTQSAAKPSYYLFVELDLTNRSDRPAFDLFRYQLDCGDGKPLENAADAAVAYRSNQNLNLFAEIQPGETETVADGFLVPESCLNSDDMTLNISSAGEGKGEIPVRLK